MALLKYALGGRVFEDFSSPSPPSPSVTWLYVGNGAVLTAIAALSLEPPPSAGRSVLILVTALLLVPPPSAGRSVRSFSSVFSAGFSRLRSVRFFSSVSSAGFSLLPYLFFCTSVQGSLDVLLNVQLFSLLLASSGVASPSEVPPVSISPIPNPCGWEG